MWLGLWGKTPGHARDLDPRKSRDLPQRPRRLESPLPNRVFRLGVDVYNAGNAIRDLDNSKKELMWR